MKKIVFSLMLVYAVGIMAVKAFAVSYIGDIDLVQSTSNGTRFYISSASLSLYASGDYKEIMLQGFYQKSNFSIGYTIITCPGGIGGTCGSVNFVSVHTSNF